MTSKCILPGAETLKPEEQAKRLREICVKVFSSDDGKIVLNMLLTDLRLYEECISERDAALNEYAKYFIRERLGVIKTIPLTDSIIETAASCNGGII
jgi:hypothetical protein